MSDLFKRKFIVILAACASLFYVSNVHAEYTIITGSYAHIELAEKRLHDPAFSMLNAYLLRSKSGQYVARVAVGCYPSPEAARLAIPAVRKAGAKGVWLLDVGSKCRSGTKSAGRATSALRLRDGVYRGHSHRKARRRAPLLEARTAEPSDGIRQVAAAKDKPEIAPGGQEQPAVILADAGETRSSAPSATGSEIWSDSSSPFRPVKWLYKKGKAVAYTSGINPATFKQAKSSCYMIRNFKVASIDDIIPPSGIGNYEFQSEGGTCYVAYIYYSVEG